ncbi:MAG: cytochrome C [Acidobacteria bacterium]|nr:cytochrome C [Acidobacteriota bacterium]
MASTTFIKLILVIVTFSVIVIWGAFGTVSQAISTSEVALYENEAVYQVGQDDYVGSETCKACHEQQFDQVAKTIHGKLGELTGWKGKVVGCEACHGPGREHVEGGGDRTKIKIFKEMDTKAVSESCLTCHAGRENHNNFRRGDHFRNNVGCTDCHSAHGSTFGPEKAGSITFANDASRERPTLASRAMLIAAEPQLCISCHSEMKAQFSKPFRHKVLEGTMNCSDCHNPHGGFESKQTRVALGSDQSCLRCHTQMQGPFAFEHAPLKTEGCGACHTPHGSNNPKMLKRSSVRQLCLECHTNIVNVELDPNIPTGPHTQTSIRTQNCTVCHSQIHGSNSNKDFFR